MTSILAQALTPVREYTGSCHLVLSKKAIEVRKDEESLGKWAFEFIRRFHSQDLNYFSFTSGRRGPYGVQDYTFKLKEDDLKQLQFLLSQHTGAKFDTPRGTRSSTVSSMDSAYTPMNPSPSNYPGYMQMNPESFNTLPRASLSTGNISSCRPMSPLISPSTTPVPLARERPGGYDRLDTPRQLSFDQPVEGGTQPLEAIDGCGSPLTRREMKQLKKFDKEPLVNKSPTIHARRKAEYIDIDLPDTASDGSTESSGIYDVPTSRQSLYDVPPPARPLNQNLYDVPSSLSATPQVETPPTQSIPPRPSSTSPTHRALPHLPTDYENVNPAPLKKHSAGYVNVGYHSVKPTLNEGIGLYMEVPLTDRPHTSKSMTSIYSDIPDRMESQLTIRRVESDQPYSSSSDLGLKLAKALEEDGYEFINPATSPALKSPPVTTPSVVTLVEEEDEDENDMYIEVHRPSSPIRQWVKTVKEGDRRDSVDFFKVKSRSKRLSDGYEEISEVIKELREKTPPSMKSENSESDLDQHRDTLRNVDTPVTTDEQKENLNGNPNESPNPYPALVVLEPQQLSRHSSSGSNHSSLDCPFDEPSKLVPDQLMSGPGSSGNSPQGSLSNIPQGLSGNSPQGSLGNIPQGSSGNSPETTKLIFNGEVKEYKDSYCSDEDNDFEVVTISEVSNQNHTKERSSSDSSNSPKTRAVSISRESKYIATNLSSPDTEYGMVLRKRSSTLGDIIDTKEPKKHTYVNVPDTPPNENSPRSMMGELHKKKPPMPLPRPPSSKSITIPRQSSLQANMHMMDPCTNGNHSNKHMIDPCTNGNHSNNKVKSLVRQFSDF